MEDNMNCIYLKKKIKKRMPYLYCSLNRQIIDFSNCKSCSSKEYKKCLKSPKNRQIKAYKIKSKTSKLSNLENNRFSIITSDMDHCIICGKKRQHLHELVFGKNRLNSIRYGLVVPICRDCHELMHNDAQMQKKWHIIAQQKFEEKYDKNFIDIFHINYL